MKKLALTTLTLAVGLVIAGCGEKKTEVVSNAPTVDAPATQAKVEVKKASSTEELFNHSLTLNGFTVGGTDKGMMANPDMVVYFDPQCPHCGTFWNTAKLLPQIKAKWIPVALMNDKSKLDGSTILSSANPEEAMNKHESLLEASRGLPESELNNKMVEQVLANTDYFAVNLEGFPTIVYRTPDGKFEVFKGAVDGATLMAAMGITSVELKTADTTGEASKPTETASEPVKTEEAPKVKETAKPAETVATPDKETGTVVPKEIKDTVKDAVKESVKEVKDVAKEVTKAVKEEVKTLEKK